MGRNFFFIGEKTSDQGRLRTPTSRFQVLQPHGGLNHLAKPFHGISNNRFYLKNKLSKWEQLKSLKNKKRSVKKSPEKSNNILENHKNGQAQNLHKKLTGKITETTQRVCNKTYLTLSFSELRKKKTINS